MLTQPHCTGAAPALQRGGIMTQTVKHRAIIGALLLFAVIWSHDLYALNRSREVVLGRLMAATVPDLKDPDRGIVSKQSVTDSPTHVQLSPAIIAAFVAGGISLVTAVIASGINYWYYSRQLRLKETEQEVQRVQGLLDAFYGPFKTLKKTNANLERLLKLELTDQGPTRGDWRTLELLLEGHEFSANQKVLIDIIIAIDGELDRLIDAHCGLITSAELQERVHLFRAHYRVIKAACERRLQGEFWRFRDYVYPTGLDDLIDQETARLQEHLASLRRGKR